MLEIENKEKFAKIVADALRAAHRNCQNVNLRNRWIRAIARAVAEIETNGTFMQYERDENYLLVWSQKSNQIYSANGICQCFAFTEHHFPCWHRAAARLVRNYFGLTENLSPSFPNHQQTDIANIPLSADLKVDQNIAPPADSQYRELSVKERNAIWETTGGGEAYGLAIREAESVNYLPGVQTGAFRFAVFGCIFHGILTKEREIYERANPSKNWLIWLQARFPVEIGGIHYKQNETPYLKRERERKPEKVGGVRI